MLSSAHSYENAFIKRFFWGAGQKLLKSLTSKLVKTIFCKFLFMIAPFRVESLNNKLKDMWIQWSPDFSNPRFPKPPNISNQTLLPLNLLHSSFIISSPISVSNSRFLWNFSAGMDYLIFLQRLDQEGWVVSCRFHFASYCCGSLQNFFTSGLFFGSDCFFDYTRLFVTSEWFYPP